MGVGFGGPVDAARGRTQTSYQVEGWTDFPLADWLSENLGVPAVVVQNDADTAGLAEARFGAGKGCSPLLYLTIGSGIGGALILDGQIYRGGGLGAVEIGHLEVPVLSQVRDADARSSRRSLRAGASPAGPRGGSRPGEAQDATTGWCSSGRTAIRRRSPPNSWRERRKQGDERAGRVLDQARRAVAFALRQAIALLGPATDHPGRRGLAHRRDSLVRPDPQRWSRPTSSGLSAVRSTSSRPPSARRSWFTVPWPLLTTQPGRRRDRRWESRGLTPRRRGDACLASRSWAALAWCSCKESR